VFKRKGFTEGKKTRGSHRSYIKDNRVATVVLGKKEMPRGTLKSILAQAGISEEEFLEELR
jgi:predicted RNA binding protein YcfA (HicA-like mRNA interferase family)